MSQAQLLPTASPFQFNDSPIRTQAEGDHLWFAAKDVCAALGIGWNGTTLSAIPVDWQSMRKFRTLRRGEQNIRAISEPAVYKLAFRSNKPEADAFTNWIASEVVPAIRKTGKYEKPVKQPKALPEGEQELAEAPIPVRILDHFPKDMKAGRRDAMKKLEKIMGEFYALRNVVRLFTSPGGYSLNRSLAEKERYEILENLYQAADANLAAAYNALEAGYRLGREVGRG